MDWLKEISKINFLHVCDLIEDINNALEISESNIVTVPLFNYRVKYKELVPVDEINFRDDYMRERYKIAQFLESKKIIGGIKIIKYSHRWDNKLEIVVVDEDNIRKVFRVVKKEYKKRFDEKRVVKDRFINEFWDSIHSKILNVSKSRFESGQFADSVEAAFKEINTTVKEIYKNKTGIEKDNRDLMLHAFNLQNPVICLDDISTQSGKDIQDGYKFIFAGSMQAIRNPKTHANITISPERAIHFLFLASLLMAKLDEQIQAQ